MPKVLIKINSMHFAFQWLYEKIAVVRDLGGKLWTRLNSMLEGERIFHFAATNIFTRMTLC